MNDLLTKLRKAVDHVLEAQSRIKEIALSEFPEYVIKSIETIINDRNQERATHRLIALKKKVDDVLTITKQSAGAAEDIDSEKIVVTIFEEPGLTDTPKVERELSPIATGGALGTSAVASPDGTLGKALESLRLEVAELKRSLQPDEKKESAKGNKDNKDPEAEEKKQGAKKPKAEENADEEALKAKKTDKTDKEDETQAKHVSKGNAVIWPNDMNETLTETSSISKRNMDVDWGSDPEKPMDNSNVA